MKEKKKNQEKKTICIDCNSETNDYYNIQTNRGDVPKCKNCYELWIIRSTRYNQNRTIHADSEARSSEMNRKSPRYDNGSGELN